MTNSRMVGIRMAAAAAVAGFVAACTAAPAPAPPPVPESAAPAPRYGPECDVAIARARAVPSHPALRPPEVLELLVPRSPTPSRERGRTILIEVPVDSAGRVDTAGVRVSGAATSGFAAEMRRLGQRLKFRPATLEGCGVPGIGRVTFRI